MMQKITIHLATNDQSVIKYRIDSVRLRNLDEASGNVYELVFENAEFWVEMELWMYKLQIESILHEHLSC